MKMRHFPCSFFYLKINSMVFLNSTIFFLSITLCHVCLKFILYDIWIGNYFCHDKIEFNTSKNPLHNMTCCWLPLRICSYFQTLFFLSCNLVYKYTFMISIYTLKWCKHSTVHWKLISFLFSNSVKREKKNRNTRLRSSLNLWNFLIDAQVQGVNRIKHLI